jgi:hypothetical protein
MAIKDDFIATMHFKHDMLIYANKHWTDVAGKINNMFKLDPPLSTDDFAVFEFFLAILFIESRAPYNLFDQKRGERIWQYLGNSFSVEKQYGDYATESLEFYLDIWSQYIAKMLNPIHGIASALLYKLGYEEKDTDILLGTVLSDILALSPAWWKLFSEDNQLENSDVPLDIEKFKVFVGESSISYYDELKRKPDGTYLYYDDEGEMHEGWMPPENIKKLVKKYGKKKLTKVFIKGPWEGVKEDFWDIKDETIEKFADNDGIIYVMCHFESGEAKYYYLNKRLWDNKEKIEEILMNPQLSEEEKKEQIDKQIDKLK